MTFIKKHLSMTPKGLITKAKSYFGGGTLDNFLMKLETSITAIADSSIYFV